MIARHFLCVHLWVCEDVFNREAGGYGSGGSGVVYRAAERLLWGMPSGSICRTDVLS